MTGEYSDLEIRIIDGLALDIEENADLPEHGIVLYKRPISVFPDDCPLLTIWLLQEQYAPLGTYKLNMAIGVGISWQEQAVDKAEELINDPEGAKSQLVNIGKIRHRVRALAGLVNDPAQKAYLPGVPELDILFPHGIDFQPPASLETGLVEGYAMTVEAQVEE